MTSPGNLFDAETDLGVIAEAIESAGYAVVCNVLQPSQVKRLANELGPHIDAAPFGATKFLGSRTKRVVSLFGRSQAVQQLAIHPLVLGLADRLLLPYCVRYQINYTGVMHLEPGEHAQVLHRDNRCYPFANPGPPTILATMWSVTDFCAENGATRVVPGSQIWGDKQTPVADEIVVAQMPPGSVVLYTGGVFHGGGANNTQAPRTGVAIHYSLGWLRQVENQYLAVPPALARTLPEQLQRLIGYDYGGPTLGFVAEGDPHQVLEDSVQRGASERTNEELETAYSRVRRLRVDPEPR